uniref:Extensin n=2 Tax=Elaeis guineensis var. tenera TaxID=51953 RepID=A0A6I9RJT8_ELAGV|nr:extensin [Elaeis guineensis]
MSIQGQLLEVTVVSCSKLKDTEWISRQDPFVCLEYATTKFRTRTCTDGGRNPCFQEKTMIPLIEGLREISVGVWNSNTITYDDFIGSGRVQLQRVLSQGYDDSSWSLQSKSGKYAGEVKLIMHYANAGKAQKPSKAEAPMMGYALTAPVYNPATQYAPPYAPLQSMAAPSYPPTGAYPAATPYPAAYPPPPCLPPANPAPYQPAAYPPPMPPAYRTAAYPPTETYPPAIYPPPPQAQLCYPPAPYRGVYPPPPY